MLPIKTELPILVISFVTYDYRINKINNIIIIVSIYVTY